MPSLDRTLLLRLLQPYLENSVVPEPLYEQLSIHLDLLLKWNARTNLTAVRDPEEMVRRHFGESLFAAGAIPTDVESILDFGSGAGFPGLPLQLLRPEIRVTLAESQHKKASFLREVVRSLGLSTEVWPGRVEAMPAERRFDLVSLRAVDAMPVAIAAALPRARRHLVLFTTAHEREPVLPGFAVRDRFAIPETQVREILVASRSES